MKQLIYYSLLFLWVLSSCTHDDKIKTPPINTEEGEIGVVFSVSLPAQTTNPTYAMDDVAENHLETIDILAFRVNSDGTETFVYKAVGTAIESTSEVNKKKFRATLIKKNYAQRFVLIANAHDEIEDLGTINDEGVKEEVLKRLIRKNDGQWKAKSSTEYTPFPMWGESNPNVLTDATTEIDPNPIKLLRMAARIDVVIDPEAIGNFKLGSVALFNRKTHGHIVPNTTSGYFDSSNRKAIKATIPDESQLSSDLTILGPTRYTSPTTADSAFVQEIYTFEAAAVDNDKASQATCIVVGGIYENDTDTSYYRLDFVNRDSENNVLGYKDILRNHLYKVNIVEISGRGYDNEEDAFNAKPMNMEVIIREWDQGDYGNIVFDGQYLLAVDPGEYNLSRELRKDIPIKIFTDYPKGWTAVAESNVDWLTITSPLTGAADTDCVLLFDVKDNDTGATRSTKIKITAGRLTYEVVITQSPENIFDLIVTDINDVEVAELIFPSLSTLTYVPISQNLKVTWSPCDFACGISDYNVTSDAFLYDSGSDPMLRGSLTDPNGIETLTIQALSMSDEVLKADPFHERVKRLDFTANNGSSYKMKSVFLRQTNYTVVPEGVAASYDMDGSSYSFTVKSNAMWTAEIEANDDPNNIIVQNSFPTSGGPDINGQTFNFTIVNDENFTIGDASAIITFKSPEGKFHDVKVTIVGISDNVEIKETDVLANCYIVRASVYGMSFPVAQANADGVTRLGEDTEFDLELLWADHPNFLGPDAAIASYQKEGKGVNGRIIVKPGSESGNGVIALKVNGVIKWSWHIWVIDYDPDVNVFNNNGYTIMDRNLGAISEDPNANNHMGVMYQWGRKDPFPGPAGRGSSNFFTIYEGVNQVHTVQKELVSLGSNVPPEEYVEHSIKNPILFMKGSSSYNNWIVDMASSLETSAVKAYKDGLWGENGSKTAYDPCPAGWKLPLSDSKSPINGIWSGYSWNNNIGFSHPTVGFFPATGQMNPEGNLTEVGTVGYYWGGQSVPNGSFSYGFAVRSYGADNTAQIQRVYGRTVRCVKE